MEKQNMDRRRFLSKIIKYGTAASLGVVMVSTVSCEGVLSNSLYTVDTSKCDGCGDCLSACNFGAISIQNSKAEISSSCAGCGKCPSYCKQGAISRA